MLTIPARTKKPYEYNMVRVDNRDRKITTMLQPNTGSPEGGKANEAQSKEYEYDNNSQWTLINYMTVRKLRADVRESAHKGLCEMFQNHTFIGVVDEHRRLAAVQHGVKLYLVDYAAVCFEMFYQIGLSDFANFGHIRLNPSIPLRDILEIAIEEESRTSETQNDIDTVFDWEVALQVRTCARHVKTHVSVIVSAYSPRLDYREAPHRQEADAERILCDGNHRVGRTDKYPIATKGLHAQSRKASVLHPPTRTQRNTNPLP